MRCVDDLDTGDLLNRSRITLLVALIVIAVGYSSYGRVFSRWTGRSNIVANLTRLGGTVAYESEIELNGGSGRLTVLGFDDALDTVGSQIRRILDLPGEAPLGSGSSLHIIKGDSTTHRLVLLRFDEGGRTLAIDIEQANADFLASQNPPGKHRIKAVPSFPGSTPMFFAEDVNTKLRIAVNTSAAPTDSIRKFYDQELRARGWTASLSDDQGTATEMPLYHRRSELLCLLVVPSQAGQTQQITLLHKELGNTTK
ncbi:MAG: hypothetical protein HN341_12790 [Verrucomicrobia bacterium]|jgi:hypothetical protein|nr:hypothetical protein [Verrucomicrobiota bacterium]